MTATDTDILEENREKMEISSRPDPKITAWKSVKNQLDELERQEEDRSRNYSGPTLGSAWRITSNVGKHARIKTSTMEEFLTDLVGVYPILESSAGEIRRLAALQEQALERAALEEVWEIDQDSTKYCLVVLGMAADRETFNCSVSQVSFTDSSASVKTKSIKTEATQKPRCILHTLLFLFVYFCLLFSCIFTVVLEPLVTIINYSIAVSILTMISLVLGIFAFVGLKKEQYIPTIMIDISDKLVQYVGKEHIEAYMPIILKMIDQPGRSTKYKKLDDVREVQTLDKCRTGDLSYYRLQAIKIIKRELACIEE